MAPSVELENKLHVFFQGIIKKEVVPADHDSSLATNKFCKENSTPVSVSKSINCDPISYSLSRSDCSKETNNVNDPKNKDFVKSNKYHTCQPSCSF